MPTNNGDQDRWDKDQAGGDNDEDDEEDDTAELLCELGKISMSEQQEKHVLCKQKL